MNKLLSYIFMVKSDILHTGTGRALGTYDVVARDSDEGESRSETDTPITGLFPCELERAMDYRHIISVHQS